jgi:hypothetical protein
VSAWTPRTSSPPIAHGDARHAPPYCREQPTQGPRRSVGLPYTRPCASDVDDELGDRWNGLVGHAVADLLLLPRSVHCRCLAVWWRCAVETGAVTGVVGVAEPSRASLSELIQRRRRGGLGGFVGRRGALAIFRENLTRDPVTDVDHQFLFHVHGVAGVGKTALLQRWQFMAREHGAVTALVENVHHALEAMEVIRDDLSRQGCFLPRFDKMLATYQQLRHQAEIVAGTPDSAADQEREADPSEASTPAAVLARTSLVALGLIPGMGAVAAALDPHAVAQATDRLRARLSARLPSRDVQLVFNPVRFLTPVFLEDLQKVAARHPWIILLFDGYERTGSILDQWLTAVIFSEEYEAVPANIQFVISSQGRLDTRHWGEWMDLVDDVPLDVFTEDEARSLLAARFITDEETVEAILRLSGRLPLLVSVLASARPTAAEDVFDASDTAVERFLKWIEDPHQRSTVLSCALPLALDENVFRVLAQETGAAEFAWLVDLPFVTGTAGLYRYHPVVRGPVLRLQRTQAPAAWHRQHHRLADAFQRWRQEVEHDLDSNRYWDDPVWREHLANEIYHRLCADPQENLPAALMLSVDATVHSAASFRRWGQMLLQAGTDADIEALTHWGHQLETAGDLASRVEALADHQARDPASPEAQLGQLSVALGWMSNYVQATTFEGRDRALQAVRRAVDAMLEGQGEARSDAAVEAIESVALRLLEMVEHAEHQLNEAHPPRPRVSLALEQARATHNTVTVQVEVANAEDSAPVESAKLLVECLSDGAVPAAWVDLVDPVPGGASRVVFIRMRPGDPDTPVSDIHVAATLQYRPRSGVGTDSVREFWRIPVARPEDFQQVSNPYLAGATGRPVESGRMFFGRDELIDRVRARLRNSPTPGVGVAIFGQKRTGKSSIRLHLMERLRVADGMLVVDIGNIGDLSPQSGEVAGTRLLALLLARILQEADEALLSAGAPLLPPGWDRASFLDSEDPVFDCAVLFERHRRAHPLQHPIVVLIDEFQYLATWVRQGLVTPVFMQAFKALVERRLFHMVIVGQSEIDQLMRNDPNVFGVFSTERVAHLDEPHARQLIVLPTWFGGAGRFSSRAVDAILDLTGGNAFFIQRFCCDLVEYMNEEHAPQLTEADVARVQAQFLDRLELWDFDSLEPQGRSEEYVSRCRAVLLSIARASDGGGATLERIAEGYRGETLKDVLRDLVARNAVRLEAGVYRIVVGFYRDWLLRFFGPRTDGEAA